jgi:hypothetical protein
MTAPAQFPFIRVTPHAGPPGLAPYIPISLEYQSRTILASGLLDTILASGLLDTGAAVNVLPFDLGVQLGGDWDKQSLIISLAGNLANVTAKALLLTATVVPFPPVHLAFAWAQTNAAPLILGQVNFFDEFDACFFHSHGFFEVKPK